MFIVHICRAGTNHHSLHEVITSNGATIPWHSLSAVLHTTSVLAEPLLITTHKVSHSRLGSNRNLSFRLVKLDKGPLYRREEPIPDTGISLRTTTSYKSKGNSPCIQNSYSKPSRIKDKGVEYRTMVRSYVMKWDSRPAFYKGLHGPTCRLQRWM